jgi:multisubunit Na+/H+ antiporter MnhB subunit
VNPRRSIILAEADRWLFHVILLVSVYVTFRGHNAPGGGFAGGLIASLAFVLRYLAGGSPLPRARSTSLPTAIIGVGLVIAVGTAIVPLFFGGGLLESDIAKIDVPLIGEIKLVSSAMFDLGVYVVVLGVVLTVLTALAQGAAGDHDTDGAEEVST